MIFLRAWVFSISGISRKVKNLIVSLNTFLSFFTHPQLIKVLKLWEKHLSSLKISSFSPSDSTTGFINHNTWGVFSYEDGHIECYVKSSRFTQLILVLEQSLSRLFLLELLEVSRSVFPFIRKLKISLLKKYLQFAKFGEWKCIFFSQHFNFAFWSRNFVLPNFSFTLELKKVFLGTS